MAADRFANIIRHLAAMPTETEWIEFKVDNWRPDEIGEQISALANSAALLGEAFGYVIWGIRNSDHVIVGTKFDPRKEKQGNEELENWLSHNLSPSLDFRFDEGFVDDRHVVLMRIPAASTTVQRFKNKAYISVGSIRKPIESQ